jgi:hypothetical protein
VRYQQLGEDMKRTDGKEAEKKAARRPQNPADTATEARKYGQAQRAHCKIDGNRDRCAPCAEEIYHKKHGKGLQRDPEYRYPRADSKQDRAERGQGYASYTLAIFHGITSLLKKYNITKTKCQPCKDQRLTFLFY